MNSLLLVCCLMVTASSALNQRESLADEEGSPILQSLLELYENRDDLGLFDRGLDADDEDDDPDDAALLAALEQLDERSLDDVGSDDNEDDGIEDDDERSLSDIWMEEKINSLLQEDQLELRDFDADSTAMVEKRGLIARLFKKYWPRIRKYLLKKGKAFICRVCQGKTQVKGKGWLRRIFYKIRVWVKLAACHLANCPNKG